MAERGDAEVVYGRRAVAEARRGRRAVRRVWTANELSPEELSARAGSPDHQGLVAEVDPYPYADPGGLLEADDALVVVCDEVQDPRNLGAICRSAEVAGATGVVIPRRRSAAVSAVTCKASAGAVEHLDLARVRNVADWLGSAKESGAWIYGAAAEAATSYDAPDYEGRVVVVVGGEGRGIRPRVAAQCDQLVSIPRAGRIDSLNVSVAAAVLLFEVARRRSRS